MISIEAYLENVLDDFSEYIESEPQLCELKNVNFNAGGIPDYTDKNIEQLYLLRYAYAYSFEYKSMYDSLFDIQKYENRISVASIGCGSMIDYWSLAEALKERGKERCIIKYKGIDVIDWDYKLIPREKDDVSFIHGNAESIFDKAKSLNSDVSTLDMLKDYHYYFQFTLNSYGKDVEINVPSKSDEVIETFKRLSDKIGHEKVIWRYDPIFLNEKYSMEYHTQYFQKLAFQLKDYTEKCTISFMDDYPKIKGNIAPLNIKDIADVQKLELVKNISNIWHGFGLKMDTCAEDIDLSSLGVAHAKCIDDKLIERIIGYPIKTEKDKNQRLECGCVASIDIGIYNTCQNGCKYCYANHSLSSVNNNFLLYDPTSPLLCSSLSENDKVSDRPVKSQKDNQLNLFTSLI